MTPNSIRNQFFSVLEETESNISSYVNNPGSDMTRHRKCNFKNTITATLCFAMNRTNTELFQFFGIRNKPIPSKSAFTQQRKKLNSALFPHLLESFNQAIPFKKTFKGYHLVAVDGTDINLPTDKKDNVYCVKQARSENYYYQMHLNALFDICENRYISALTQPRPSMNEPQAFLQMVDQCFMPKNTIFIADRGYISLNTLAHLQESQKYFLIRAKAPSSNASFLKNIMITNQVCDEEISIGVTRSKKNKYIKNPSMFKSLHTNQPFEPISVEDRHTVYELNIRCTCIKLGEDDYEYLVSNLPMDVFSNNDLRELYWKRWGIETSFRHLKYALSLVYLHSVNRELIIQEVFAKIIMYNFASLIHSYGEQMRKILEKKKSTKYQYHISFSDTIPIAKELLKRRIKNNIIKNLLLSHLTATRQAKPSTRRVKSQTVKPLNNRA